MKEQKGKLIVIDGTDGSGKGTQVALLLKRLKKEGHKTYLVDFPQYGKKSAGPVEELLNGKYGMLNPYQGSLLYAVDRLDASFGIHKALAEGRVVIANRYTTANAGHQGAKINSRAARKKFFVWLEELEFKLIGLPRPNLTLILHVPAKVAYKLIGQKDKSTRTYIKGKKRDFAEKDKQHLKRAEETYLEIAKLFPKTELVECAPDNKLLSIEQIHELVWQRIKKLI
jgi:dTMP kinase